MMMVADMADRNPRVRNGAFLHSSKRLKAEPRTRGGSALPTEKKDKVGERLAVLQQLVAPFGKSDTTSVLTEATAYIKFLHDQLQVLVTPYLRSSPNGRYQEAEEWYSLRSRGLCLIPVDATAFVAGSNGADIWAPISK